MSKKKKPLYDIGFKVILPILGVFLSLPSCSAQGNSGIDDDTYQTVSKVKKTLPPKRIIKHIDKSTEVKAYEIDALSEDSLGEKVYGFCVVGSNKVLNNQQAIRLKQIVANDSSYIRQDNVVKFSTFLPDYAFKFMDGKDSVVLFLDFHADMWSFRYKKKEYIFDNEKVSPALRKLVEEVFNIKLKKAQIGNAVFQNAMQGILPNNIEEATRKDSVKQYVKLSGKIQGMIKDADSISCFILDPLAEEKTGKLLEKYVVLLDKPITNKDVIDSIKKQLLGNKSFPEFDYAKNCTFLPDIAFVFYCKKGKLNVLFSFYCNECKMFVGNKQEFSNDCSNIQSEIIGIARKIFPKDKYLRTISK